MLQPDFAVFPEMTTERLLLRKLAGTDAKAVLQLRSDENVMRYLDRERAATIADAEAYISKVIQSLNSNEGITWAIALKEEPDLLIGTIGYWRLIREHFRAEIGYMLAPSHWNKGLMKEALLKVIDMGFNWLKLHSIEANINPENEASAGILVSTNFIKEAHFKENFYYNGVFKDTIIYSRLQ